MQTEYERIEKKLDRAEPLTDTEVNDYISFYKNFLDTVDNAGSEYRCLIPGIVYKLENFNRIRRARDLYPG